MGLPGCRFARAPGRLARLLPVFSLPAAGPSGGALSPVRRRHPGEGALPMRHPAAPPHTGFAPGLSPRGGRPHSFICGRGGLARPLAGCRSAAAALRPSF
eukprot:10606312-Alexandrium_andersonii.AAC.1